MTSNILMTINSHLLIRKIILLILHTISPKVCSNLQTYEKEVEKQIQNMPKQGIIRESNSPRYTQKTRC